MPWAAARCCSSVSPTGRAGRRSSRSASPTPVPTGSRPPSSPRPTAPRLAPWSRPTWLTCSGRSTSAASASTSGRRRPRTPSTPTSSGSTSTRAPASCSRWCRRRHARFARCSTSSGWRVFPRRPATAASTCTSACNRAGPPTRCVRRRWPSPGSSSAAAPISSPAPGGRRNADAGSSSTSTRTRRTRRSSAPGRCARVPGRRSRRRSRGMSWMRSHPTRSPSRRCRPGCPRR